MWSQAIPITLQPTWGVGKLHLNCSVVQIFLQILGSLMIPSSWSTLIRHSLLLMNPIATPLWFTKRIVIVSPIFTLEGTLTTTVYIIKKNNAKDTNYIIKKIYKMLMWWMIIGKWKSEINGRSRWKPIKGWSY